MKNRIITISLREIKKSFKRFLSLVIMSFLGVAVFVGMRSTAKIMLVSLDKYYDDNKAYDLKVVSTLGLTEDDIIELEKLDLIEEAYGIHSKDVYFNYEDTSYVLKINAIHGDINNIIINEGRMPLSDKEIVVEEYLLKKTNLKLGDMLTIDDPENVMKNNEYKIVGTAISPVYLLVGSPALSRGTSAIGSGLVNYYSYTLDSAFEMEYYSEIYLKVKGAKELYTSEDDYNSLIKYALNEVLIIKPFREQARYDFIYNKVMSEIKENEDKANKELSLASEKLASYKNQLDNGLKTLNANKLKIENGKQELAKTWNQLSEAKKKIDSAEAEINKNKSALKNAKEEINNKLNSYGLTYDDVLTMMDLLNGKEVTRDKLKELVNKDNEYRDSIYEAIDYLYDHNLFSQINKYIETEIESYKKEIINAIPKDIDNYDKVIEFINSIKVKDVRQFLLQDILSNKAITELKKYIPTWIKNYDKIIEYLDKYAQNTDNIKLLFDSIKKIDSGEKEIAKAEAELNNAKKQYEEGIKTYQQYSSQLVKGEKELNSGYNSYYTNLKLYNTNLNSFNNDKIEIEKKLNEAKNDINSLEVPTWYVTNRLDNNDYFNYINVGDSINRLAKAFPTIFFIVAVFMSVMSMSRMALEDRQEIGSLKALGFSNINIMTKYFIYASSATLIGGILGSIFGFYFLSFFIWKMYRILFTMPVFKYYYDIVPFMLGILVAFICITGTALLTVKGMVSENTASLLRPKSPPLGKKIFLEKIPLWNKIRFSNKVTIRNVFRYKKRVTMTIIGIVGCTILLLTGYGIRDSITNITKKQYSEVMIFDNMIYFDNSGYDMDELFTDEHIKNSLYVNLTPVKVENNDCNLFAIEDEDNISNVIQLKSNINKNKVELKDDKIVISEKLAQLEKLKVGDKIKITDNNKNEYEIEISDITINYIGNPMYINKYTYEKYFGEYKNNVAYLNFDDVNNSKNQIDRATENEHVLMILDLENTKSTVSSMLKSLDSVVYILIVFAGLLSFVVLYNLSYINISERKREISTLKVLGFYNSEVDNYIIKENIIITLIGIGIGILLGKPFVDYIVNSIEVDLVRFVHIIDLSSYLKTGIFMIGFTLVVSIIIHFALKKIDMIESLKSVE